MKAKLTPTKDQLERVNQQVWQHCLDSLSDDLAVDLIVLHQSFGFGEKRIRQFLEEKKNLTRRVEGYGNDDIKKEKIDEMLSEFGIAHDEIYFKEDMKQYVHERKVQERVSLKESIEIQRDLEIMKSLIGV